MNYISDRIFRIWTYSVSHSSLILRSTNDEEDEVKALKEGFNIDIEFSGVGCIVLPVNLKGILIKEIIEKIPEQFNTYSKSSGYRIFEVKSDQTYYVVAASCLVGKNNWLTEDRISNPNLEYDELLAFS